MKVIGTVFGLLLSVSAFGQELVCNAGFAGIRFQATLNQESGLLKFQDLNSSFLTQGFTHYSQVGKEKHYFYPYSFDRSIEFIVMPTEMWVCTKSNECFRCK